MKPTGELKPLLGDLRLLIEHSRGQVAVAVNAGLVRLYWQIGHRLRTAVLKEERADYGEHIIIGISQQLVAEYGRSFSHRNLRHMMRFSVQFQDFEIVNALSTQLSWTHFRELLSIEDPLKRSFYTEMCRLERWSTRTLKAKIGGMLFERTAISKRPTELIEQELNNLKKEDQLSPDLIFRDPYLLDFLGLPRTFLEKDVEAAILKELERFLMEMGDGFCFVARQKRMQIGPDDYYLDLLFFHRRLHCLVAIELKLGRFDARDKGQLELYLRWLDRYERQPGEGPPLGLILCSEKNQEQVKLLQLDDGNIRVAEYLTELPPRQLLERKLHEAIQRTNGHLPEDTAPEE